MRIFYCLFMTIVFLHGAFAYAANVQVIGTGQVMAKPDRINFSLTVQSLCYSSLKEASNSADKVSAEIYTELNKIFSKRDLANQISTQGGYTQRFDPPRYHDKPSECQNTFQKTVNINVSTTELSEFEGLFNQVQQLVYGSYLDNNNNVISKATTFVTMSEPQASLSFLENQKIEFLALDQALKNAVDKAKQLVGKQYASTLKIIEISETISPNPPYRPMMRAAAMEMSAPMAPISFQNNMVEKSLSVIFEY